MTGYKQLCAELLAALEEEASNWNLEPEDHPLVERARAALAEPQGEGPTDDELLKLYGVATPCHHVDKWQRELDFARAVLARWGTPNLAETRSSPLPISVSERLPRRIEQALIKAECALSDIAEGEAEESEGDPLEWAEKRASDALARIRPVMRQHQIQTSEWPPLPAHALPQPSGEVGE